MARNVDDQAVDEFVVNYRDRLDRGLRRSRLAVDQDHNGRALGWYQDVMALPEGVGSTFQWNRAGREALEANEFAYFSATVYWQMRDRVTNQTVNNVLAGGALTNYPYFGEATALFCLATEADAPPIFYAVTKTGPHGDQLPARAYLVVEDPSKPSTWHLPVMSWRGGKLVYDHKLMGAAKASLTAEEGHRGNPYEGPQKAEALAKLKRLYEREGLEFTLEEGGFPMSQQAPLPGGENADQVLAGLRQFFAGLIPGSGRSDAPPTSPSAEVLALQAQVEALSEQVAGFGDLPDQLSAAQAQADEYRAQVETLQGDLGSEREARQIERFRQMAGSDYAHLPVQIDALGEHLRWLYSRDTEEEQPHATFFSDLLRRADEMFVDAFRERGSSRAGGDGAMVRINAAIEEYQEAHANTTREEAMEAIFRAQPDLYEAYQTERSQAAQGVSQ
jgi:hypothetical protein